MPAGQSPGISATQKKKRAAANTVDPGCRLKELVERRSRVAELQSQEVARRRTNANGCDSSGTIGAARADTDLADKNGTDSTGQAPFLCRSVGRVWLQKGGRVTPRWRDNVDSCQYGATAGPGGDVPVYYSAAWARYSVIQEYRETKSTVWVQEQNRGGDFMGQQHQSTVRLRDCVEMILTNL